MRQDVPDLVISASPFVKRPEDTPAVMRHVLYALVPALIAAVYFFGLSALLVVTTVTAGCLITEYIFTGRGDLKQSPIADGSAIVTGVLLAMTLPPGLPLWMAFVGGVVAIVFGKILFGGLGQNIFNPSLTGRAFLQAAFPVAITTWAPVIPGAGGFMTQRGDSFTLPFTSPDVDAITTATPLARMKFEGELTQLTDLLFGSTSGSIGETSAVLLLLGGVYLAYRKFLNWRVPVGIFATVYGLSTALHLWNGDRFPAGEYQLLSGGLILGAVFMATDPVTSPVTPRGSWIFAFGVGLLVVAIRQFGGLPEGVMYSILLMNALTPLIDRYTQPRVYGTGSKGTSVEPATD
jgi:electron transport complex protein RnfD